MYVEWNGSDVLVRNDDSCLYRKFPMHSEVKFAAISGEGPKAHVTIQLMDGNTYVYMADGTFIVHNFPRRG